LACGRGACSSEANEDAGIRGAARNRRQDTQSSQSWFEVLIAFHAIGTIAALFLHLLLPEDRVLDEEKEGYPRAFES
jgi:hypothetical protein